MTGHPRRIVMLGSTGSIGTQALEVILALTAAIWHNRATSQPTTRSLIAYDH